MRGLRISEALALAENDHAVEMAREGRPAQRHPTVELTSAGRADPVAGRLPVRFPTLQWHSDTFELPPGATLLASSPAYPNQAFRVGRSAYAVQFHLEVTQAMAEEWAAVPAYAQALEAVLGPGALADLFASFAARQDVMQQHARTLFGAWWQTFGPAQRHRAE